VGFFHMATEKQITANRANAKRSTGPKTVAGRMKSSRNAFRHGFSAAVRLDIESSPTVDAMVRLLAGNSAGQEQRLAATEMARAQLALLRIRATRAELMADMDLMFSETKELKRLAALDRYERYAHTRRRRASYKL
jgi:hypothetical protein